MLDKRVRTAVLIHGCHLQAELQSSAGGTKDWEKIVWAPNFGTPTLDGRGTMGLLVAFRERAEFVIFSTGASERQGVKEGEYTLEYAKAHAEGVAKATYAGVPFVENFLREQVVLDLESQNTREECERNFRLCAERGIELVFIVSSPWHIQRCHTEALKVAEAMRERGEDVPEIVAVASHGPTEGVVILEPPHRGDQPKTIWHKLAPRFFRVPSDGREDFENAQDALFRSVGA